MFLKLDRQKMEVVAWCGMVEEYKPTANIKKIYKRVEDLKKKMEDFMAEVTPELNSIENLLDQENQKYIVKK